MKIRVRKDKEDKGEVRGYDLSPLTTLHSRWSATYSENQFWKRCESATYKAYGCVSRCEINKG